MTLVTKKQALFTYGTAFGLTPDALPRKGKALVLAPALASGLRPIRITKFDRIGKGEPLYQVEVLV